MLGSEGQGGGGHVTSWRQSTPGGGDGSRYTLSKAKDWGEKAVRLQRTERGGWAAGTVREVAKEQTLAS